MSSTRPPTEWFRGVGAEDRAAWGRATSIEDLGECMASWLERRVGSRPGYRPNQGPAPETEPLRPLLVAYNRAGLVTTSSQPGLEIAEAGSRLVQRAALSGCCRGPVRDALIAHAGRAGLLVRAQRPRDARPLPVIPITRRDDAVVTCLVLPSTTERAMRHWSGAVLSEHTRAELERAWVVVVVDPVWGRPDRLWEAVGAALQVHDHDADGPTGE